VCCVRPDPITDDDDDDHDEEENALCPKTPSIFEEIPVRL
jgi:hypothetical protein